MRVRLVGLSPAAPYSRAFKVGSILELDCFLIIIREGLSQHLVRLLAELGLKRSRC